MDRLLEKIVALRDNYKKKLKAAKQELSIAREKGQNNYYQKMQTEVAVLRGFLSDLNDIIEEDKE